jgi:hypothetical protein
MYKGREEDTLKGGGGTHLPDARRLDEEVPGGSTWSGSCPPREDNGNMLGAFDTMSAVRVIGPACRLRGSESFFEVYSFWTYLEIVLNCETENIYYLFPPPKLQPLGHVLRKFIRRRMSSSGMWRCVDPWLPDVSEERIASIFRVEKSVNGESASAGGCRLSPQS